jgi:hypothetical protein
LGDHEQFLSPKELGMAEEQVGLGKDQAREPAPWTKIFSAFRVAADPKKLLLAAGGIFVMALGWWILATLFYSMNSKAPQWADYDKGFKDEDSPEAKDAFKRFKQDRGNWNLLHKLAGPVEKKPEYAYDVADFTYDLKQYNAAQKELKKIQDEVDREGRILDVKVSEEKAIFGLDGYEVTLKYTGVDAETLEKAIKGKVSAAELIKSYNPTGVRFEKVKGYTLTFAKSDPEKEWQAFTGYVKSPKTLAAIENELVENKRANPEATRIALKVMVLRSENMYKPAGWLSTWPWNEYRGPNPFLMVTGMTATAVEGKTLVKENTAGNILTWLFTEQIPVLLEPLAKFLSPVIYFLHPAAYFWTRVYLLLVILWTIATWSFFGAAITRMASVQVARPTERVGMVEAIRFAMSRYRSYVASQLLPFAFLAGIAIILLIFGFFVILLPVLGDLVIAGLGFPLVLLFGIIMAVVLIGLIGWPMMYGTISTEGSDSFDAISRSYSYVYQAPWQYLWYSFLALLYGAVLVFFVGLMGSLLVYLGKWGMSLSPVVWELREPSYLYRYAPTSYGWSDLLLHGSPYVKTEEVMLNNGRITQMYVFQKDYLDKLEFYNNWGAGLVGFWLSLVFLMIIGFGYSFFWTASSIIYLLMRRKVDDTELDEVHLEEEEVDMPAYAAPGAAAAPAPGGRSAMSLNVVEGPPPASSPTSVTATPAAPAAPARAEPVAPSRSTDGEPGGGAKAPETMEGPDSSPGNASPSSSSPKKTQLAPSSSLEEEETGRDDDENGPSSAAPGTTS